MIKVKQSLFWLNPSNSSLAKLPQEAKNLVIINAWLNGSKAVRNAWSANEIVNMARPINSSWHWVQIGLQKDLEQYTKEACQAGNITVSLIEHLISAYYLNNDKIDNEHSPADKSLLNSLLLEMAEKFAGFGVPTIYSPYPGEAAKPLEATYSRERYFTATKRIMYYGLLTNSKNEKDKETLLKVVELEFQNHLKHVGNLDYILTFISEQSEPDNILINTFLKVSGARSYYKILSDHGRWASLQEGTLDIPTHQMQSANLVHAANAYPQFAPIIIDYVVKIHGIERFNHFYNVLLNKPYDMKVVPEVKSLVEKYLLTYELSSNTIEPKIINKI